MQRLFTILDLRKLLIVLLFISFFIGNSTLSLGMETTIMQEGWEHGIGNWTADNGLWEVGIPAVGPDSAHSDTNCIGLVLNGTYPASANTRLISPSIALPTPSDGEKIQLKFWQWFSTEDDYDICVIQISKNSGPWETISNVEIEGLSLVWTQYIADLTSYAGSSVRIGFYFTSNTGAGVSSGWFLDDISIQTETINFPNPEDFESGIGNWSADNGLWEVGIPSDGPANAHSGTNCVGTVLNGNYPASANTRLISPSIVLPTPSDGEKIQLKFWQWFSTEDDYDNCVIQISKNSGPWETISNVKNEGLSLVWTQYIADLTSYSGSSVRIGFYFTTNTGSGVSSGWFLDDISIQTETENFPNPEDFESGIGNWSADNGLWEVGIPTVGPENTHSGTNCVGTVLNGNYPASANTRLISPEVKLSSASGQNPMLFFYHWYITENDYDIGYIQVSIDGGEWQTISNPISGDNQTWSQFGLDLSDFADSTIRIAFYFTTNTGSGVNAGWYIDDIRIEGITMPTGIIEEKNDFPSQPILLQNYPNPFTSTTQFRFYLPETTEVSIVIFNSLGQQVSGIFNTIKPAGTNVIDFDGSNLSSGLYFYQIRTLQFQQVNTMFLLK